MFFLQMGQQLRLLKTNECFLQKANYKVIWKHPGQVSLAMIGKWEIGLQCELGHLLYCLFLAMVLVTKRRKMKYGCVKIVKIYTYIKLRLMKCLTVSKSLHNQQNGDKNVLKNFLKPLFLRLSLQHEENWFKLNNLPSFWIYRRKSNLQWKSLFFVLQPYIHI